MDDSKPSILDQLPDRERRDADGFKLMAAMGGNQISDEELFAMYQKRIVEKREERWDKIMAIWRKQVAEENLGLTPRAFELLDELRHAEFGE